MCVKEYGHHQTFQEESNVPETREADGSTSLSGGDGMSGIPFFVRQPKWSEVMPGIIKVLESDNAGPEVKQMMRDELVNLAERADKAIANEPHQMICTNRMIWGKRKDLS